MLLLWMLPCRENHGVQTMYDFAEDCGSMERSRYFGFSKGAPALGTSHPTQQLWYLGSWQLAAGNCLQCLLWEAGDTNDSAAAAVVSSCQQLSQPESGMHAAH